MSNAGDEDNDKSKTSHIDKPLGERLRLERNARKLTRGKLAEKLDVSESTVQQWEEGRTRLPASRLWQICRMLEIDVADVFETSPHHVTTGSGMADGASGEFIGGGARGRRVSALAKAGSKLPDDRLAIAVDLVKALKPKY